MNGPSYFPDGLMLARIVTEKILFPRRGNCLVKGRSPANNTVFVNMYLCIVAFLKQGNNTFSVKGLIIVALLTKAP